MNTGDITNGDPEYWIARGRSDAHARLLAEIWRRYPDLPIKAPVEARMARTRERVIAMRPILDAVSAEAERERRAKNFAFIEAQRAAGKGRNADALILVGRDRHGYDWDEAVQYANAHYAAAAGWARQGPSQPLRGTLSPTIVAAYDQGFRDGGGDPDDLVAAAEGADAAHIILLSGLRADDTRSALAEAANREDIEDILIAVADGWLADIDAHAATLPLARTMERLLRRAQMKLWIARGRVPGAMGAAGHIRWGKAISGLSGRLGDFSAHYDGPAVPRGHRIVVRGPDGTPATGFYDPVGVALAPETVISNRSRLRDEMARILRSFAASTRLGPMRGNPTP